MENDGSKTIKRSAGRLMVMGASLLILVSGCQEKKEKKVELEPLRSFDSKVVEALRGAPPKYKRADDLTGLTSGKLNDRLLSLFHLLYLRPFPYQKIEKAGFFSDGMEIPDDFGLPEELKDGLSESGSLEIKKIVVGFGKNQLPKLATVDLVFKAGYRDKEGGSFGRVALEGTLVMRNELKGWRIIQTDLEQKVWTRAETGEAEEE